MYRGEGNGNPVRIVAWRIPRTEESGKLQSIGSQRVRHNWSDLVLCMEKAMAPHSSTLAWKIPWMEEPGRLQSMRSLRVGHGWATSLSFFTFIFHFHALEKEMATHSSVLAWRIPGTGEPGGLPSMRLHRVGHDWSNLAAAAAVLCIIVVQLLSRVQLFATSWTTAPCIK